MDQRRYINPFIIKDWAFAKCPDWLFSKREVTHSEKHVYAKLLLPLPPICRSYDKRLGIILEHDQRELAATLGVRRETVNAALKGLRLRRLLEITGSPGGKQDVRFLAHEWMPTCALNAQVLPDLPVRPSAVAVAQCTPTCARNRDHVCSERTA